MLRIVLFILILLVGCGQVPISAPRPKVKAPSAHKGDEGMRFRLTPGADPSKAQPGKKAKTTPLTGSELEAMLKALPALQGDGKDAKDFALRQGSQPPPRTARTLQQVFPPPTSNGAPPKVAGTRLEVTNIAPRGAVEMAPHLTVSFNQAMVPLTTVEQLDAKQLGIKLTPAVEGKWRWLGTQTLMFVPQVRFPMATSYTVEIPAGLKSSEGKSLAAARVETFETPPPRLEASQPEGDGQDLNPLIFLRFDQAMDNQTLAGQIRLTCSQGQAPALRPATRAEILESDEIQAQTQGQDEKRWLVLKPEKPLQPGTSYTVEVPAGTASAEGPLTSKSPQTFSFATYDPLSVVWKTGDATPLDPWNVQFNNSLQADKFQPDWVKVSPEVADFKVRCHGSGLTMTGRPRGQSSYQITLSPECIDSFGQRLGKAETFTVRVGKAEPSFQPPNQTMLMLDPTGPRTLPIKVVNYNKLRVRLWKVKPSDWKAFQEYQQETYSNLKDRKPPGQAVEDHVIDTKAPIDQETEVAVDLSSALSDGLGHVVVQVEVDPPPKEEWRRQVYLGWVQSTQIGLDALADHEQMVAWANDLQSGQALSGVEFRLNESQATSDREGLARLPLPPATAPMLLARKGEDVAFLAPGDYYGGGWNRSQPSDRTLWHVFDDRGLYRPGETVHIKGWSRHLQYGPKGDLQATANQKVSYRLADPVGNEILKGEAAVGALGGFNFQLKLPKTVNLGTCSLQISGDHEGATQLGVQVQEFRRPEFEVTAEASPATSQIGSSATVTASAAYFSGGPLANAQVDWSVNSSPTTFSPPGWDGFTFGTWTPWWPLRCWWNEEMPRSAASNQTTQADRTDSKGKAHLKVDFLSVDPPQPHNLTAQATVQDVNRQSWTTSTSVLVHPANLYVGLKSSRTFVESGQPLEVEVVVTDLEGKAVANHPVLLKAYRLDWENGESRHMDEIEVPVTSGSQSVKAAIPTTAGGTYQLEAYIQDEDNRSNRSQLTLWVAGGKQPPATRVEQEQLTLIPSQREYQPGDSAEVLVQAPFAPAELVVTTRRNGIASVQRINAQDGSANLKIPLEEINIPGLQLQVDAVGSQSREEGGTRPAYASGNLLLAVSNASRKLEVTVRPAQAKLQPGGSTELRLDLHDSQKKPVQGEVTVLVVDESVLALSGYDPADPLASFSPTADPGVSDSHSRRWLLLQQDPDPLKAGHNHKTLKTSSFEGAVGGSMPQAAPAPAMEQSEMAPMASARGMASDESKNKQLATPPPPKQFKVRTNFDALALVAPTVSTDARGQAQVTVKLPDNLTRYRIIALASAGVKQFGKGESSLVARQPLQLRPSLPRFLNFGDHCQLPVMVQNQSDQPMQVALVCRAGNALVGDAKGKEVGYKFEVPANDRLECPVPCQTDSAGTARFQFGAAATGASDAAEASLPVWIPATSEAFATYGVVDKGAVQQAIEKPANVWPQFGGLSITTTSTALSELTDAFLYLAEYPYGCTEQVASRMLAAAALKDVLSAFHAPGMADPSELKRAMAADLDKLRGLQCDDGGWDYWVRNRPSLPYLTVHIAHALVRCKQKGFAVDESMLDQALNYLSVIETHLASEYGADCRRSIRAYALYVLDLAGRTDGEKARDLIRESGLKNLEVMGWLLPTLAKDSASRTQVDEIYRYLDNHATQTASTAQFSTHYGDNGYLILYSDRRDDGLLLESLIATRPRHPLIPKLVRGLLDHRTAGRWENTQENCWVLLALDRYFHQYESVTPNFVAQIWLGPASAGQQTFRGRDKNEKRVTIPIDRLQGEPLTLAKTGAGRLYYRLGLDYCPRDLKQVPADYGFAVQRSYESVRDNRDVTRDDKGAWHIKAGAEIRVNLTMQAPSRRYHVALVDPLPAGLEAVNPSLLGTRPSDPPANRADGWWSRYWYQHENLRDERVEAFTQLLWEGVYNYSYVARATTLGTFVVPPTKAEEMYHPETFGRSASDTVIVE